MSQYRNRKNGMLYKSSSGNVSNALVWFPLFSVWIESHYTNEQLSNKLMFKKVPDKGRYSHWK